MELKSEGRREISTYLIVWLVFPFSFLRTSAAADCPFRPSDCSHAHTSFEADSLGWREGESKKVKEKARERGIEMGESQRKERGVRWGRAAAAAGDKTVRWLAITAALPRVSLHWTSTTLTLRQRILIESSREGGSWGTTEVEGEGRVGDGQTSGWTEACSLPPSRLSFH